MSGWAALPCWGFRRCSLSCRSHVNPSQPPGSFSEDGCTAGNRDFSLVVSKFAQRLCRPRGGKGQLQRPFRWTRSVAWRGPVLAAWGWAKDRSHPHEGSSAPPKATLGFSHLLKSRRSKALQSCLTAPTKRSPGHEAVTFWVCNGSTA